jgi:diguanylate cyclase (GGDEF)-like protein
LPQDNILDSLLKGSSLRLPTLPVVGLRVVEACKSDDYSSTDELARIISTDPHLTMKTLRWANSPLYARLSPVKSVHTAIGVLGSKAIKNIALSFIIINELDKGTWNGFNRDYFWRRAVTSAVAAEVISQRAGVKSDGEFAAALLMDIGIIVMLMCRPEDYHRVLEEKRASGREIEEVEREAFGYDHQEVGKEVLKRWSIPEAIFMPIAYHHKTTGSPPEYSASAAILEASSLTSSMYHGSKVAERFKRLKKILKDSFGCDEADLDSFVEEVAEKSVKTFSTFDITSDEMKSCSQILQEANEELGSLGIEYGQLVLKHRRSSEESTKLALELKESNKGLKEIAYKDSITGLYNHRFFLEMLDKEVHRAERYSRRLSLLLFDIDNFKEINDNYGHKQGDKVLEHIGRFLEHSIRKSDIAARLGGDEFAIMLPDTDRENALSLAEKLRGGIEALGLNYEVGTLKFTVSIGVGTYVSEMGEIEKDRFFEDVDKALYRSKEQGKNRISTADIDID